MAELIAGAVIFAVGTLFGAALTKAGAVVGTAVSERRGAHGR